MRKGAIVYGSGGFTSYTDEKLAQQLAGWVEQGIRSVKMKIGREPQRDPERVRIARDAIGQAAGLYVDANGAYTAKQALALADNFSEVYQRCIMISRNFCKLGLGILKSVFLTRAQTLKKFSV